MLTDDGPLAHRGAARSRGHLRAAADRQARAALHRLRRQDPRALRARHDGARDSGVSRRDVRAWRSRPDLISTVTDAVVAEVTAWQSRPLEPMYPVVFFDALRVKIRDEATVRSKAVYLALAVLPDGTRDILGLWIEQTEGAKFWMKVFTRPEDARLPGHPDRRHRWPQGHERGARPRSIPATTLQTCIVHLIRNSLDFANWKERKPLAAALRPIYTAPSAEAAQRGARRLRARPVGRASFPTVVASWRRAWTHVIPFFAFPPEVRRVIYTTNALESVHAQLRKIIKTRGHFPTDEAATKLIWLALRNITAEWERGRALLEAGDESIRDPLRGSLSATRRRKMQRAHGKNQEPRTKTKTKNRLPTAS